MYSIFLGSQPKKFLKKIDKLFRKRIWKKLDELKSNQFPHDAKRVVGRKEKAFRVRIGSCRIQYYVFKDKKEIVVFNINKRERAFD
jgi:mRNA interferase RelE/StbE|tara:strand:+ start:663 stop:920 length:258 start_codon:yes stop_codon:yes gene_type:complete